MNAKAHRSVLQRVGHRGATLVAGGAVERTTDRLAQGVGGPRGDLGGAHLQSPRIIRRVLSPLARRGAPLWGGRRVPPGPGDRAVDRSIYRSIGRFSVDRRSIARSSANDASGALVAHTVPRISHGVGHRGARPLVLLSRAASYEYRRVTRPTILRGPRGSSWILNEPRGS